MHHTRKDEEERKINLRDGDITTIIKLQRTAYRIIIKKRGGGGHYPNLNSKIHASLDLPSLLHPTFPLTTFSKPCGSSAIPWVQTERHPQQNYMQVTNLSFHLPIF